MHGFYGIGALLSPVIASILLSASLGWNTPYIMLSVGLLLFMVSLWKLFSNANKSSQSESSEEGGNSSPVTPLLEMLNLRFMWLVSFFLGPILPTILAFMAGVVPRRILVTAISFTASIGSVGKSIFPWLEGNVFEAIGMTWLPIYLLLFVVLLLGLWPVVCKSSEKLF